jgi:dTDP-L-rhamnose 4-epimerase
VVTGEYRLGDIRHGYADLAAIRACLQFQPEVPLDQGLTRFVEWVKTQPLEPDLLAKATGELVARGLMPAHFPNDVPTEIPKEVQDHVNAKAATV